MVKTGEPFTVVTAPLDVALPTGLSMRFDDVELDHYYYGNRISNSCMVGTGLTNT